MNVLTSDTRSALLRVIAFIVFASFSTRALPQSVAEIQYAGNIGLLSAGPVWEYGHDDRWQSHLLIGLVPESRYSDRYAVFTARQTFIPWQNVAPWQKALASDPGCTIANRLSLAPLTVSAAVSTVAGNSSLTHLQFAVGSRLDLRTKGMQRLSIYYELSAYDLAIISAVPNKKITLRDILCLGIGVQYRLF
ncbi:MAG: hypothetical protein KBT20_01520 [Bacteroidales bacterium]|nr:hypothetical protein [Candidatus Liminaster caballi]